MAGGGGPSRAAPEGGGLLPCVQHRKSNWSPEGLSLQLPVGMALPCEHKAKPAGLLCPLLRSSQRIRSPPSCLHTRQPWACEGRTSQGSWCSEAHVAGPCGGAPRRVVGVSGGVPGAGHRGETSDSGLKDALSSCNQTEQRAGVDLDLGGGQVGAPAAPPFFSRESGRKGVRTVLGNISPGKRIRFF